MGAFGRYELLEVLGRGGFATVHLALDPILERQLAIKVLHGYLVGDSQMAERFIREGRSLARVNHPNLVKIYDAGTAENQAFLAMEYIRGTTLAEVAGGRQMQLSEAVEIVRQIAGAIGAVHAEGLIHRDIKPANIIVQPDGRAVLLDLGVARDMDSTGLTATGLVIGTPGFLAPEQVDTSVFVGPSTDVYQLAATTYTLLAGKPLYEGDTAQVLYAVAHRPPPDLGEARPDLPFHVIAAVTRALSKDPAMRPATVKEFADAFGPPSGATKAPTEESEAFRTVVSSTGSAAPAVEPTVVSSSDPVPPQALPSADANLRETKVGLGETIPATGRGKPSRSLVLGVIGALIVVGLIGGAFIAFSGGEDKAPANAASSEGASTGTPSPTPTATAVPNGDFEPLGTLSSLKVADAKSTSFKFPAPPAQAVSFVIDSAGVGGYYRVFDERGKAVGSPNWVAPTGGMIGPTELPSPGNYLLQVEPDKGAGGELRITMFEVPKAKSAAVIPGGSPVTLSVDVPGALAAATFEASAGQLFSIQTYDNSGGYFLRIEATPGSGPSVVGLSNRWIAVGESFVDTFAIERAGRYSLIVDPEQDSRVQTTLRLFSLPASETRPVAFGESQTILTSLPGENAEFSFQGKRDQVVAVRLARVQSGSYVYIKRVFSDQRIDTQWAPPPSGTLVVITLPATDEYIITVDPEQSALESATFTLFDVSERPAATAQIDGAAARVTADFPGQQAVFHFQSAGGELVTIRSRERDDAYITVFAPSGAEVVKQQYLAGNGQYQLRDPLVSGEYTVVLTPSGFDPPSYSLEFVSR